jgi:nicotinate phosphoribosyltransferase
MKASFTNDSRRPGGESELPDSAGEQAPALLTDLYQLTMMDVYYRAGMEQTAVFEFFVRRLPEKRNFLIAAGLEQALQYLETLRFTPAEIEWLAQTQRLSSQCLERLRDFRFSGDVYAMPEGTVFFASEPVLRVQAPLPQAQLVESRLVNLLQYQTLVAAKAARCRIVAGKAQLIDFGMRRAHGAEAALVAARASYIGGFDATATVEAARRYGIPAAGTMAHSFVQAHALEIDAFEQFAAHHPDNVVLLIDTYDTLRGAQRAAEVCLALRRRGAGVRAVRIDSGDLAADAQRVRAVLDRAGCQDIAIMVSSSIDEYAIAAMRSGGAPIDAYCVGTRLSVSADAPSLDCAYKLQQYAGKPCRKRSQWKETWPGPRQVYRQYDRDELIATDVLGCADEAIEGVPLLRQVMRGGRRTSPPVPLQEIRRHCSAEIATLPLSLRSLGRITYAPVKVSPRQHALVTEVDCVAH